MNTTPCHGKVKFTDMSIANKAASRKPGLQVYRCKACRSFHVGNKTFSNPKYERKRKQG